MQLLIVLINKAEHKGHVFDISVVRVLEHNPNMRQINRRASNTAKKKPNSFGNVPFKLTKLIAFSAFYDFGSAAVLYKVV